MPNFSFIGSLEVAQNYYSGWVGVGWSDKTKVIPNSTQLKFKLKLEFEFGNTVLCIHNKDIQILSGRYFQDFIQFCEIDIFCQYWTWTYIKGNQ